MHKSNFRGVHVYFVQHLKPDSLSEDDTAVVTALQE